MTGKWNEGREHRMLGPGVLGQSLFNLFAKLFPKLTKCWQDITRARAPKDSGPLFARVRRQVPAGVKLLHPRVYVRGL
jgi:hypothetical protein